MFKGIHAEAQNLEFILILKEDLIKNRQNPIIVEISFGDNNRAERLVILNLHLKPDIKQDPDLGTNIETTKHPVYLCVCYTKKTHNSTLTA